MVSSSVIEVRRPRNRGQRKEQSGGSGKDSHSDSGRMEKKKFLLMTLTLFSPHYNPSFYGFHIISTCFNDT